MATSFLLIKEVNSNWLRTKYYTFKQQRQQKQEQQKERKKKSEAEDSKNPPHFTINEVVVHDGASKAEEEGHKQPADIPAMPLNVSNPYSGTISLHIHHWQIFYVLAFFTR